MQKLAATRYLPSGIQLLSLTQKPAKAAPKSLRAYWLSFNLRDGPKNLQKLIPNRYLLIGTQFLRWTKKLAKVDSRKCLKIVVLTERKAKLNSSAKVAAFVKDQLSSCLDSMKRRWGWANAPKVILHDKATPAL